jgi:hypothetical protein
MPENPSGREIALTKKTRRPIPSRYGGVMVKNETGTR